MTSICIVEDDPIMGASLSDRFGLEGFDVEWFTRGEVALESLLQRHFDVVVSDVRLPDLSGEELFRRVGMHAATRPPWIFISAYASVERAVALVKQGAGDFVTKPFDITELVDKVRRAVGIVASCDTQDGDERDTATGSLPPMARLRRRLPRIAIRARTVLINGEGGTGKETLARQLHVLAHPHTDAPFVVVTCGTTSDSAFEALMFGHERGAFNGADRPRRGQVEQAQGGTLFLDEVADLSLAVQSRLLRVIQDRRSQRLGSDTSVDIDFRLFVASRHDLAEGVRAGRFREDLFYAINVVRLHMPPLRDRIDEVIPLAEAFLAEQAARLGEAPRRIGVDARAALLTHGWPGNVRELRSAIERACVLSRRTVIGAADLFDRDEDALAEPSPPPTLDAFVADAERAYMIEVLRRFEGRVGAAAVALGISRKTLWEKTRRYALNARD
jgi:DNA-binding NtrC family response regulator